MRASLSFLASLILVLTGFPSYATAEADIPGIDSQLLREALSARALQMPHVDQTRYLSIVDYSRPSSQERFYFVDLEAKTVEIFLVAHGRGSDPDHDGIADTFSNTHGSKMSSLGAFVTGQRYYGRHGLSLKLKGLEPQNDQAEARAIVIHGADYVSPDRALQGRSWGCPALSRANAERLIPLIEGGTFLYIVAE